MFLEPLIDASIVYADNYYIETITQLLERNK